MRWFAIAMLAGCLPTEPHEGEVVVDRAWHLGGFGVTADAVYWTTNGSYSGPELHGTTFDHLPADRAPLHHTDRAAFGPTGFVAVTREGILRGTVDGHEVAVTGVDPDLVALDATGTLIWTVGNAIHWHDTKQHRVLLEPTRMRRIAGTADAIYGDDGATLWRIDKRAETVTRASTVDDLAAAFPNYEDRSWGTSYSSVDLHADAAGALWMLREDGDYHDRGLVAELADPIQIRVDTMYPEFSFVLGSNELYWFEPATDCETHEPSQTSGEPAIWRAPRDGLGVPPQLVRRGGQVLAVTGSWVYVEEPIDSDISAVWRYPL